MQVAPLCRHTRALSLLTHSEEAHDAGAAGRGRQAGLGGQPFVVKPDALLCKLRSMGNAACQLADQHKKLRCPEQLTGSPSSLWCRASRTRSTGRTAAGGGAGEIAI